MSIVHKAVRGAAWTIAASVGSRLIGLVGTILLARFLLPDVAGEVSDASVLVLTANYATNFCFGQYIIAKRDTGREAVFHATVFHVGLAVLAGVAVYLLRDPLGPVLKAPTMGEYVPGLVLAMLIERVGVIPERVLIRDMRFRAVAIARTIGEVSFTVGTIGLAAAGYGGQAIVGGNIVRAVLQTVIVCLAADRRDWLTPFRIRWELTRDMFRYGTPLLIGGIAHVASRRWDNWLFSWMFGPFQVGLYNQAYNLADVPATHVGEQIGDVLMPSFSQMDHEERKGALLRSTRMLAVIIFPMAVGLGAIANTLIEAFLPAAWYGVAPMLAVLSFMSVVRPIGWTILAYMQSRDKNRHLMAIEIFKVIFVVAAVALGGRLGPLWACAGVGVAFALSSYMSMKLVEAVDGVRASAMMRGLVPPLLASAPIAGAVFAVRYALAALGIEQPIVRLVLEMLVGGAIYVPSALILAPQTSREFLRLVVQAFRQRRGTA